ncbi:MAG: hypothetical protein U5K72_13255 [Balneolaceae bacterium]|nr:hypothetical protein [Balneolaceae bacterium]
MHSRTLFSLIAILMLFQSSALAQFEGEISFHVTNPNQQSDQQVQMDMTFTENRIFVNSNVSMDVMAGLRARGVLVRHDMQDFVVFTNENEGLQVAKNDLDSLVKLMNQMQGRQQNASATPFPWEERLVDTGQERVIHGYNTHQFILKGERESEYVSVWLTDEIVVDWGLLSDAWYAIGSKQLDQEVPIEIVMNNQSFPLLVESFEGEQVVFRAESVSVDEDTFDRNKTTLSPGLKLIGLTDLMMNMFRQN